MMRVYVCLCRSTVVYGCLWGFMWLWAFVGVYGCLRGLKGLGVRVSRCSGLGFTGLVGG